MIAVRRATMLEAETLLGQRSLVPGVAYVGEVDGRCIGAAGLAWGFGRCWLWLNVLERGHATARFLLTWARKLIAMALACGDRAVFVQRDATEAMSERLCRLAGFAPIGAELDGFEVWQWHS